MKYLVFDISNLLYRTFFVQREESDETLAGLATHSALVMLNKYFKQHKPDKVVMAFDRSSWRKQYTSSEECVSKKAYKGNRRKDMTPAQQIKYKKFTDHMNEFEALIDQHTTIITLFEQDLEADDLIAGFCQKLKDSDDQVVVISSDSDLLQLLRYPNVTIVSPATDKLQVLAEYNHDPELYVFTKCLRGDSTDNVQSAYPGVRSTRILKAYTDPFERVQLMKETWDGLVTVVEDGEPVQKPVTFRVEKLFEENQKLIDLEKQPDDIRELLEASINASLARKRQFSMFFILKFIGKYKLIKIKESLDQYIPMLSK
jgi:5'-3' exonuclease